MEIVSKKKPSCRFDEIEMGQCFVDDCVSDLDTIYMRIEDKYSESGFTAVDLRTGRIYSFDPDGIVTPIDAKVEIG